MYCRHMHHLPFVVRPFSVDFVLAVLLADPLTEKRKIRSKKNFNINLVSTIILASKSKHGRRKFLFL